MTDTPPLNPAIRDIAGLAASIAIRCPSMTHTLAERLRGHGLPEGQIREVVEAARAVSHEARIRGESMLDAVLAGESPTTCMQSMDDTASGGCCQSEDGCNDAAASGGCRDEAASDGCCGETRTETCC